MPVLGTVFFGLGVVSIFVALQNYLVDGFRFAASALAASTVLRSLFGYSPLQNLKNTPEMRLQLPVGRVFWNGD
jgi:hypothetical protein